MVKAIIVTGPTATGKSFLASTLAAHYNGVVLNADSMQIYKGVEIITAAPRVEDEKVPHRLYGVWDAYVRGSALKWGKCLQDEIALCEAEGVLPVICGGTGMYLDMLLNGYHDIPDVPHSIVLDLIKEMDAKGSARMHAVLCEQDPEGGTLVRPSDRQRIVRRLSVLRFTGRTLSSWHQERKKRLFDDFSALVILVMPPRDRIYRRCDARIDAMMSQGVLDEVSRLSSLCSWRGASDAQEGEVAPPVCGALGVSNLLAHVRGEVTLDEAMTSFKTLTRRYVKRQMTWFRHQLKEDIVLRDVPDNGFWGGQEGMLVRAKLDDWLC